MPLLLYVEPKACILSCGLEEGNCTTSMPHKRYPCSIEQKDGKSITKREIQNQSRSTDVFQIFADSQFVSQQDVSVRDHSR